MKTNGRPRSCVRGIGVDLVENERMQAALNRWGASFKRKIFLPTEQSYCDSRARPASHYAARFAVKEAVSKAFGTGVHAQLHWRDIEVVRDPSSGAPSVRLSARGRQLADRHGVSGVQVSLAHTRRYAVATALLIGSEETS